MRRFVAFAVDPAPRTAASLPFASEVRLGLGRDLSSTLSRSEVARAHRWVLDAKHFRGYGGPFSALSVIERHTDEAGMASVTGRRSAFTVSVGQHPHCAGRPVPPPEGLGDLRRVSAQPSRRSAQSCLAWFTVDLFLNREDRISAVTLDLWEP